ncbi:MAG: N-acetylmuramoyl-L-alanine amidase [Gemmatimonadaceae bacterium]
MNRARTTHWASLRASRRRRALLAAAAALMLLTGLTPPPGYAIRVKGVGADTVLQLAPSEAGGLVQLDVIARLLGGQLDSTDVGRWRLGLYGATLDFAEGAPFASYNGFALPLLEPTRVIAGHPYVTLQLFSEIIPRFGIGVLWDRTRWEVRLFQSIARRAEPVPLGPAPVSTTTQRAVATDPSPVATPTATRSGTTLANGLSRRYRVVVDPGHGGVDPGNPGTIVNGRRVREAELTLAISLRLEKELKRLGIEVYMTRRTDTLIARDDRGAIANARKGDLFLSIHTNAANPNWKNASGARGFETYFLSTARTEDERRVAAMENDVVRFEAPAAAASDDPLSFILADLAQNEHLRESSDFAATIQGKLGESHPGPDRGVKQAGFAVLARAFMPAVLVEIGFGTNKQDAAWMASAAGQQAAAESLAEATLEYLRHYDRRARASQR